MASGGRVGIVLAVGQLHLRITLYLSYYGNLWSALIGPYVCTGYSSVRDYDNTAGS